MKLRPLRGERADILAAEPPRRVRFWWYRRRTNIPPSRERRLLVLENREEEYAGVVCFPERLNPVGLGTRQHTSGLRPNNIHLECEVNVLTRLVTVVNASKPFNVSPFNKYSTDTLFWASICDRNTPCMYPVTPPPLDYFHVASGKRPWIVRHEHAVSFLRENHRERQGREGDIRRADTVAAEVQPTVREDALHQPATTRVG